MHYLLPLFDSSKLLVVMMTDICGKYYTSPQMGLFSAWLCESSLLQLEIGLSSCHWCN